MKIYKDRVWFDNKQNIFYQRECADIILELHNLCDELDLNFQDFKEAFVETQISYRDIKSFERVLTRGWPPAFFQNDKKRENFLKATEKAFVNCANGKYPLKRSNFETVKGKYASLGEDEGALGRSVEKQFRARLSLKITMALRADPDSFNEEDEKFQISQQHRAAKIFWDDIWASIENEGAGYERIKDGDWLYFKIHAITCVQFCEMLKNDPVIMKRLQKIFDEVDKDDQCVDISKRDTTI